MTTTDFQLDAQPYQSESLTIIPVRHDGGPTSLASADLGLSRERLEALAVSGKENTTTRILVAAQDGGAEVPALLVGIGAERTLESLRQAAGNAARALKTVDSVIYDLVDITDEEVEAVAVGHGLGAYSFDKFKSAEAKNDDDPAIETVRVGIAASGAGATVAVERARVVVDSVALTRDLVNAPPSSLVPEEFADAVSAEFADGPVSVEVWDEAKLIEEGCGGVTGVGQGSVNEPRMVRLEYSPDGASKHIGLVGKGITFDSGGLSLKPAGSMVGMKFDMSGAAAVVGTIRAVAALGLPVKVTGWCMLAENMPGPAAIKPDDVLTMRSKTTVEVTNTDAEGRLVLADGLALASEAKPDVIIDIATLTGAQVVALGDRTTGLMGNDETWRDRILAAADQAGEPTWAMPIPAEIAEKLDSSPVADIVNAKPGDRAGGMLFAAAFLERFIGEDAEGGAIPWVHLDIAGPADTKSAYGYIPKGSTGVPVRTLIEAISALD